MIGVILNHRYRIVELVGTGGMAQVYRAVNLTTKKYVAIKMLRPEYRDNPEFLRRFEREAKAVLHLSHENIVHAYGVGQYEGMPYLILEYVEGRTLKEIVQEHGPMPQKTAVNICNQVLDALSAAHAAGIIHRDVKSQNVIVTASGKAKLTDFGIARDAAASTVTFAGSTVLGSAHYISPEQAKGMPVTAESDIYSAGVMLYEMLTGTVPFNGDTTVSVALMHINDAPLPPIELAPSLTPALNEAVLIALNKDPLKRFDSARRMSRALSRALRDPLWQPATGRETPGEIPQDDTLTKYRTLLYREGAGRLHGAWKIAIVVGVFICVLIGTFLATRSTFSGRSDSLAVVPSVLNKALGEAMNKAEDYGFVIDIAEYVPSSQVGQGLILSQSPGAGQNAKPGSAISVTVSAGPDIPSVPSLLGKTYDEAVAALTEAGLRVGTISYRVSDVAIGYVCAQTPSAGTELARDGEVNISISATAMNISRMPSLLSMSLTDALAALNDMGFAHIFLRYEGKDGSSSATVLRQQPSPAESVPINMNVTLTLSGHAPSAYTSDIAYNLDISESGTSVMVTIEETVAGVAVERILFEQTMEKGEKVPVSFTATAENSGRYELILYVNGAEARRQDANFTAKE